eukprot:GHVU01036695.1.p4 GENE.GHVU01036695.1~~GHVU01036695.1.p4  ORF type:complete len:116 (+),score=10.82 GHVU01036695.1:736-1083(+)
MYIPLVLTLSHAFIVVADSSKGNFAERNIGSVHAIYTSRNDNDTLERLNFSIGDCLSLCIKHDRERLARKSQEETVNNSAEFGIDAEASDVPMGALVNATVTSADSLENGDVPVA